MKQCLFGLLLLSTTTFAGIERLQGKIQQIVCGRGEEVASISAKSCQGSELIGVAVQFPKLKERFPFGQLYLINDGADVENFSIESEVDIFINGSFIERLRTIKE